MKMTIINVSDFANLKNHKLGASEWFEISSDMVHKFAKLTGDGQWIHLDIERCQRESPFGATVVHGAFILSLIPVFVGEFLTYVEADRIINVGQDRARLREPVPVGARIRGLVSVQDTDILQSGLLVNFSVVVQIEHQTRPACTAEQRMILYV
jgi:acyl dehydratase